jgi:RNA polymerase sigma factor for flagellar operon FliA
MSGLWDALRRQREHAPESFEWYVRVRVRGAILDELRAQDWLPRRVRNAAAAGASESRTAPFVVRLDDIAEWEQHRCLATDERSNSEHAVGAKLESERLARAVSELPSRERHIVSMHYYRGVRFKDLGSELGVSEPRVSQLHSRAMHRLRTLLENAA